jgi:hypothetical protein
MRCQDALPHLDFVGRQNALTSSPPFGLDSADDKPLLGRHGLPCAIKNPDGLTWAVMDGIAHTLIANRWTSDAWRNQVVNAKPVTQAPPLCSAEQLRQINPHTWGTPICMKARVHSSTHCQNMLGCAAMEFDRSVVEDKALFSAIARAAAEPCHDIPLNDTRAWTGFSYPPALARHFLGCDSGKVHGRKLLNRVELHSDGQLILDIRLDN